MALSLIKYFQKTLLTSLLRMIQIFLQKHIILKLLRCQIWQSLNLKSNNCVNNSLLHKILFILLFLIHGQRRYPNIRLHCHFFRSLRLRYSQAEKLIRFPRNLVKFHDYAQDLMKYKVVVSLVTHETDLSFLIQWWGNELMLKLDSRSRKDRIFLIGQWTSWELRLKRIRRNKIRLLIVLLACRIRFKGTRPYWTSTQSDVIAYNQNLGASHLFFTATPADYQWDDPQRQFPNYEQWKNGDAIERRVIARENVVNNPHMRILVLATSENVF